MGQVKRYYRPRIQVPLDVMFNEPGEKALYCLSRDGVSLLRRVVRYGYRDITYVAQPIDDKSFETPDSEIMEQIRDLVGELEVALMSECDFTGIIDQLETMNATLDALAACVCSTASIAESSVPQSYVDSISPYATDLETELSVYSQPIPVANNEKCDIANVVYGFAFEFITETLLPLAGEAIDATAIAIGLTSTFAVLSGGLGLAPAVAAAAFSAVVSFLADYAETNILNWMIGNAQELVCEIYNGLMAGSYSQASSNVVSYINGSTLPFGDKAMLKIILASEWYMRGIEYQIKQLRIDPSQYSNYSCANCAPDDYYWESLGCPNADWEGGVCRDDGGGSYSCVQVGSSPNTIGPDVSVNGGFTGIEWVISASGRVAQGGTHTFSVVRRDTQQVFFSDTFQVPTSETPVDYVFNTGMVPVDCFVRVSPVGASVARIYHGRANYT